MPIGYHRSVWIQRERKTTGYVVTWPHFNALLLAPVSWQSVPLHSATSMSHTEMPSNRSLKRKRYEPPEEVHFAILSKKFQINNAD